ncbi:MAG: hypothetical protein PHR26_02620 [Candidatus ainarchaeum sp.]|nr:hypothetical protein [Candidatus ainarchaeum sp.]MDD3976156.1 hypothetical protein [Candidatus ainarchaeum sp.]
MKFKFLGILCILSLVLLTSTVSAEIDLENIDFGYYFNNLEEAGQELQENVYQLPNFIKKQLDKEIIYLELEDINTTYKVKIEKIEEKYTITKENLENYTIEIKTTVAKLQELLNSEDKMDDFNKALKNGYITIKGKGFFNSLQTGLAKFFLKVGSLFS